MRESGLIPTPVILDSRQLPVAVTLPDSCSSELKEFHRNPSFGAPICRVVKEEPYDGQITKGMMSLAPGDESVVRTTILEDTSPARSRALGWARETGAKIGAGIGMWGTKGSRSDDGAV